MSWLKRTFNQLKEYPTAIGGMIVIAFMILVSIYTVIAVPYPEAIALWRGGEETWWDHPRNAWPEWSNWFREKNEPTTIIASSLDAGVTTEIIAASGTSQISEIIYTIPFEYTAERYPQEVAIFIETKYSDKQPLMELSWIDPSGEVTRLGSGNATSSWTYRPAQDDKLVRRLGTSLVRIALFQEAGGDPDNPGDAVPGTYQLVARGTFFEDTPQLKATVVVFGNVHGLFGTDHRRRNLYVPILWGTPIALSFGLLAAVGTSILTLIIAAIGTWYGGWLDSLIQRITEVNLVLPVLPLLIMIGTFYSRSLWLMLGVIILLSIFGSAIKTYRAIFLQVKESPYIEAAKAYGAGDMRIVFRYLIPRILPIMVPGLVTLVPSFVFLEATLAVLGLGDPVLPTWGKIIDDARSNGAVFNGYYYWMLEPAVLLMLVGLGFAMLGFALDRVFNPRLRGL